jgi:hypothetical protein
MRPSIILSTLAIALVVVGVGNMVHSPAAQPACDSGQCTLPAEQAAPVVEACNGDCATCPEAKTCKKPIRKAIAAPIKAVGKMRVVAKPVRHVAKPVKFVGRLFRCRRCR